LTTLLFLGAGASQPFDIPTMGKMVTKFEEHLKKNNIKGFDLYSDIKKILEDGYKDKSKIDIEAVFSVVAGISKQISMQEIGHYPFYYNKRFGSQGEFTKDEIDKAENLRNELQEFILTECQKNFQGLDDIYERSFDALFQNMWGPQPQTTKRGHRYWVGLKVYTTNYDRVFENFWKELPPLQDYFNRGQSSAPYFDSQDIDLTRTENTFVKLHGSVDWVFLETGEILEADPSTYTRSRKRGKAMLYPIQQKDLYVDPWFTLFRDFRKGLALSKQLYVIGYGFNDEFILNAFSEALGSRGDNVLIIVNPHAFDLIEKFPEKHRSKITPLPIRFGDQYFKADFEDFFHTQRTIEIELQTENKSVGIILPSLMVPDSFEMISNDGFDKEPSLTLATTDKSMVEFGSGSTTRKTVNFKVVLREFQIGKIENLEFVVVSSSEATVFTDIRNQGREIDCFNFTALNFDQELNKYIGKHNVDAKRFFPPT